MNELDIVVVGGGAAGLSAALVLGRARRSVAVVDAHRPRNAPAAHMHGFLSRDGFAPADLIDAGRREVTSYGVRLIDATVTRIEPGFRVHLSVGGGALNARRVLVATGLRDEIPAIPGLSERWARDVLHCPYCHGYEVRDQPLGVLGGTPGAVEHALLIRQWTDDLTFFAHSHQLTTDERERLRARGVRIVDGAVTRLVIDGDRFAGIETDRGSVVAPAALFVRPRLVPVGTLLADLGCRMNDDGWAVVDAAGRTSVPGVYAAGNAVDPRAQVITAAGAGSAAAIAVNADLVDEDTQRAVEDARPYSAAVERQVSDAVLGDRRHGL